MINRIRLVTSIQPGNGESAGAGILRRLMNFAYNLGKVDNNVNRYIPGNVMEKKTANFSVTAKDHGKTFAFDATTTIVASLPAVGSVFPGFQVVFVVEQLPVSGVGHSVSPSALDQIIGNGFTPADDKDAVCVVASDRLGDAITLVCDGELGWYIRSLTGTWTREA